jgi:Bacterial transglutaminase-like N-terminal region
VTISAVVHHVTHHKYDPPDKYDRPVILEPQTIRLRPAPHCRTVPTAQH